MAQVLDVDFKGADSFLCLFFEILPSGSPEVPSGKSSYPTGETTWRERGTEIIWKEGKDQLSQHPS